ncbi:C-C chemokine receptor type 1-like [Mytilus trossulus]|uniref:C-C chemokine receptor type 1-like n=1 Tax=Mytilus trossulus TaxID=6551 RepID=UPI003006703C
MTGICEQVLFNTIMEASSQNGSLHILNTTTFSSTITNQTFSENEVRALKIAESYVWTYVSPVLIVVGILGNCLNLAVLKKLRFWRRTPLFLLFILAITDITVLLDGLLRYWIEYTFKLDIRTLSDASCKINLFVLYFAMQYSSWVLVCLIIDRFIKTNFPFLYMRVATIRKTSIIALAAFIILAGINMHFFWTNGIKGKNGACGNLTPAYEYFGEYVFTYIDLVILSLLPFTIMLILNIFVYRALRKHLKFTKSSVVESRNSRKTPNRRHFSQKLTRMLLLNSSYFLLTTVPISVYFIYDSYVKYEDELNKTKMDVARSVLYVFQYSYYSLNFVWYATCNKAFWEKTKEIFGFKSHGFKYQSETRRIHQRSSSRMTTSLDNSINDIVSDTYAEHSDFSEDIQANDSVDQNQHVLSDVSVFRNQHM